MAKASHFPSEYTSFFHSGKKKYSTIVIMKVDDMDGTGRRVRTEAPGPVTVNSIHRADTAIWLYELG